MSYAAAYPWLVQSNELLQSAERAMARLPEIAGKRERVMALLEQTQDALRELDDALAPDAAAEDHYESHDDRRMNPECRFCWPIAGESEAAQ